MIKIHSLLSKDCADDIRTRYTNGESTRDIAKTYSVSYQTISKVLKTIGVEINKGRSISKKLVGKPSHRKGIKASEETKLKMRSIDRTNRKTTKGRVYTEEQKQKMRDAFARNREYRLEILNRASAVATSNRKLTNEERNKRRKQRIRYKNLINRFISASGIKKTVKTSHTLGYSQADFVKHIQSQFREGMSWEDRESFHVDHKIPVAHFLRNGVTDPRIVNALSNLQPLYPHENRTKSDKLFL